MPAPAISMSVGNEILMAAGDLFNWLSSGIKAVINVVEDAATATWHFIAEIAGKVYRAVLDTVDAVAGAVVWVFNAIKTAIKDIIAFIKFLFEWADIKRTKEVLHNLTKAYLQGQVVGIKTIQHEFDTMITGVEKSVNKWAGIKDWSGLGEAETKPASGSASNPMKNQTSGSQHLSHHFQNNARNLTIKSGAPSANLLKSLIDDLYTALKAEAAVLGNFIHQLQKLATDFASLTVEEVLKRLVGILVDGLLGSAKVVVDALLSILADVATAALGILDAKIHIPVISDILNAIGIPDISFLDLFCWISAVAYTVVYKVVKGEAPFPDNSNTEFLINTHGIEDLSHAFEAEGAGSAGASMFKLPQSTQKAVFVTGHSVVGFMALMSDFITTFEAAEENGDNPFAIPSAVMGVIMGGSVGIANFLVPKSAIKQPAVKLISTATTGITILCKVIFSGPLQKEFSASTGVMKKLSVAGRTDRAIAGMSVSEFVVRYGMVTPAGFEPATSSLEGWRSIQLS